MRFEDITVATDLSPRSDRAVRRAAALARAHGAKLTVLHVVDAALPDDLEAMMVEKAAEKVRALLSDIGFAANEAEVACRAGDPVEAMIEATLTAPDLFVVGTHRPRAFLDSLRETTAQKTVRHAMCPVLLVQEEAHLPYTGVVCATDFSTAAKSAAETAAALLPEAELLPVTALQVPYAGRMGRASQARDSLEEAFRRDAAQRASAWEATLGVPFDRRQPVQIEIGSALAAVDAIIRAKGAKLVTVGAHGRAGAMPAFLGSVANDLIRNPPADVLIAR